MATSDQHSTRFPMLLRGVTTPSFMPAGPTATCWTHLHRVLSLSLRSSIHPLKTHVSSWHLSPTPPCPDQFFCTVFFFSSDRSQFGSCLWLCQLAGMRPHISTFCLVPVEHSPGTSGAFLSSVFPFACSANWQVRLAQSFSETCMCHWRGTVRGAAPVVVLTCDCSATRGPSVTQGNGTWLCSCGEMTVLLPGCAHDANGADTLQ